MEPHKLKKLLERSDRQLIRLTNLVEDLLNVSRINLGRMSFEPKQVDLTRLARDVADQFKTQLAEARCEFELRAAGPVKVQCDPFRIEQVLVNLLANAAKYGAGQPVKLSVFAEGKRAKIHVEDHGIGIAAKDQRRIFNVFERAASSQNYGGLGLGLYIVRRIVEEHKGVVRVASVLGKGSTFIVELPLAGAHRKVSPYKNERPPAVEPDYLH